jgi:plasmid stabilization system protein ParE
VNLLRTDVFLDDLTEQFTWYDTHAGQEVADRYLNAAEATCRLLGQHPYLGPPGGFTHPRLRDWRFFLVFRPFSRHVLFYEISGSDLILRRALLGHRDLPRRLLESPASR